MCAGWSFIVWEMATLTKPFQDYTKEDFFNHVMRGGERPILNKKWPRDFCELLKVRLTILKAYNAHTPELHPLS